MREVNGNINNQPEDIKSSTPLLPKKEEERLRTPTKNLFLPLGMFLYAVGVDMGSTTLQQYTYNYTGRHGKHLNTSLTETSINESNLICGRNSSSSQNENDKDAANWLLYFELAEYPFGLPVIVLVGIYSDFFGRKFPIVLSSFGGGLQFLATFFFIYFDFNIAYFLIGDVLSGITGTHYTFYMSASALVADTTGTGKSRSFHIAMVDVYMGIGLTLANLVSGYMIHIFGFAIPCAISAGLCFLGSFVLTFEKETLTDKLKSERPPFLQSLQRSVGFFQGKGYAKNKKRWRFILTLLCFIIFLSPLTAISALRTLYILGEPFCFSSEMVGKFGAAQEFTYTVFAAVLLKILHCCVHDETIVVIGVISGVSYFLTLAFSTVWWMVFLAAGIGILALVPLSLFQGVMSRMISEKHQGAMFALIYFCEASTRLAANILFLTIYGRTQSITRGFVFYIMAAFYVISCLLFMPIAILNGKERRQVDSVDLYVGS